MNMGFENNIGMMMDSDDDDDMPPLVESTLPPTNNMMFTFATNMTPQAYDNVHSVPDTPGRYDLPPDSPFLGEQDTEQEQLPSPDLDSPFLDHAEPAMLDSYTLNVNNNADIINSNLNTNINPSPPSRRRTTHLKDPNHIPRPPNAFILFRSAFVRAQRIPGSIEGNHSTLSKIVGMCWRGLSRPEREVWERRAKAAQAEHRRNYPDWRFRNSVGGNGGAGWGGGFGQGPGKVKDGGGGGGGGEGDPVVGDSVNSTTSTKSYTHQSRRRRSTTAHARSLSSAGIINLTPASSLFSTNFADASHGHALKPARAITKRDKALDERCAKIVDLLGEGLAGDRLKDALEDWERDREKKRNVEGRLSSVDVGASGQNKNKKEHREVKEEKLEFRTEARSLASEIRVSDDVSGVDDKIKDLSKDKDAGLNASLSQFPLTYPTLANAAIGGSSISCGGGITSTLKFPILVPKFAGKFQTRKVNSDLECVADVESVVEGGLKENTGMDTGINLISPSGVVKRSLSAPAAPGRLPVIVSVPMRDKAFDGDYGLVSASVSVSASSANAIASATTEDSSAGNKDPLPAFLPVNFSSSSSSASASDSKFLSYDNRNVTSEPVVSTLFSTPDNLKLDFDYGLEANGTSRAHGGRERERERPKRALSASPDVLKRRGSGREWMEIERGRGGKKQARMKDLDEGGIGSVDERSTRKGKRGGLDISEDYYNDFLFKGLHGQELPSYLITVPGNTGKSSSGGSGNSYFASDDVDTDVKGQNDDVVVAVRGSQDSRDVVTPNLISSRTGTSESTSFRSQIRNPNTTTIIYPPTPNSSANFNSIGIKSSLISSANINSSMAHISTYSSLRDWDGGDHPYREVHLRRKERRDLEENEGGRGLNDGHTVHTPLHEYRDSVVFNESPADSRFITSSLIKSSMGGQVANRDNNEIEYPNISSGYTQSNSPTSREWSDTPYTEEGRVQVQPEAAHYHIPLFGNYQYGHQLQLRQQNTTRPLDVLARGKHRMSYLDLHAPSSSSSTSSYTRSFGNYNVNASSLNSADPYAVENTGQGLASAEEFERGQRHGQGLIFSIPSSAPVTSSFPTSFSSRNLHHSSLADSSSSKVNNAIRYEDDYLFNANNFASPYDHVEGERFDISGIGMNEGLILGMDTDHNLGEEGFTSFGSTIFR